MNENPAIPLAHHLMMASGDGVIKLVKEGGCSRDDASLHVRYRMRANCKSTLLYFIDKHTAIKIHSCRIL